MITGLIIALVAGALFAGSGVTMRKASAVAGEAYTATFAGIFLGLPFFVIVLFITGDWQYVVDASWSLWLRFGIVGIVHYITGRVLAYEGYRLIGANKSAPYLMTNLIYAVILGFIFLGEDITWYTVVGSIGIFVGAVLITTERRSVAPKADDRKLSAAAKGVLVTLGAAVCWGVTPIIIKSSVSEIGSPYAGAFISYVVAALAIGGVYLKKGQRERMLGLKKKKLAGIVIASGMLAAFGQLGNYIALDLSPASLVVPIVNSNVLFTFIFSFLLNRHIEVFSVRIIAGICISIAATFILFT